jgi:hypothetical protein
MPAPFETSFATALLDPQRAVPRGLIAPAANTPTRRFAVHRNNVVASLVQVLEARFPVVEKLVGTEFFAATARMFVAQRPPRTPLLATYGDGFAAFLAEFAPAREVAYLADVARLEAARTRAYHAVDAVPLDAGAFAALDPDSIGAVRIELHPSAEIVRSAHPIVTIWAMNSGARDLAPIENWRGEDALVIRPHLDVEIRVLPPGGAAFLRALAEGLPLGKAAEAAAAASSAFDLTANVAGLIGWGLVRDLVIPKPNLPRLP